MEMNFASWEETRIWIVFRSVYWCGKNIRIFAGDERGSSRKALELCVKWIYSIDSALEPIGNREGLQSLLHNNGFPSLMDITLWRRLQHIVRNGRHLTGQNLQIRLRNRDEYADDERKWVSTMNRFFRARAVCAPIPSPIGVIDTSVPSENNAMPTISSAAPVKKQHHCADRHRCDRHAEQQHDDRDRQDRRHRLADFFLSEFCSFSTPCLR